MAPQTVRLLTPTGQPALLHGAGQHVLTSLPPNATHSPLVFSSVSASSSSLAPTIISTMSPNRMPIHQQNHHSPHQQQQHISHQPHCPQHPTPKQQKQQTPPKAKKPSAKKSKAADKKKPGTPGAAMTADGADKGTSGTFRDDDDINDVAAMGGVNLQEESQRILAGNADIIGQQIRSCKDENFLHSTPLHTKVNAIGRLTGHHRLLVSIVLNKLFSPTFSAKRYELKECSQDVVALVSHAAQERLKTLVEQLGVIAEHRQEQYKVKVDWWWWSSWCLG